MKIYFAGGAYFRTHDTNVQVGPGYDLMKNGSSLNWSREYPKDKDLEWVDVTDKKNKSKIDRPAFTFEDAKYNLKNINDNKDGVTLESFY